jgi:hypothetical protein
VMNRKECEWERSWPNLRYYAGTCVEILRKIMKNLSQDNRLLGRYLNPGPHESEAGVLTYRKRRFVMYRYKGKDNVKTYLNRVGCVDWVNLVCCCSF